MMTVRANEKIIDNETIRDNNGAQIPLGEALENILFDITITLIDRDAEEKIGQLRYHIKDTEAEIFDTYLFPGYRNKKIMSSLLEKIVSELKKYGTSKIRLKYRYDDARIAWEKMGFKLVDDKGNMELCLENEN